MGGGRYNKENMRGGGHVGAEEEMSFKLKTCETESALQRERKRFRYRKQPYEKLEAENYLG